MTTAPRAPGEAPVPPVSPRGAALQKVRRLAREFGPAYAALAVGREFAGLLPRRIEEALLDIEGRRGMLGPAHRRWTEHSVTANREIWSTWNWAEQGEEWSASPAWKASLIGSVLRPTMSDARTILEIGPGAGRWTEALHDTAAELILVDITDTTLELCRARLGDPPNVTYVRSDGTTLREVPAASVDGIWSFDAFVHIAPLDIAGYLGEMARVLRPGGVAVIHHTGRREPRGWRSPMTPALFANLARASGLVVDRQFDAWADGRFSVGLHGDAITQLRRPD
ncbi:MAG: class I SAM-dependent methyltransferase [Solirubrobacteraceae bacterium]